MLATTHTTNEWKQYGTRPNRPDENSPLGLIQHMIQQKDRTKERNIDPKPRGTNRRAEHRAQPARLDADVVVFTPSRVHAIRHQLVVGRGAHHTHIEIFPV